MRTGKIALEEHFMAPELAQTPAFAKTAEVWERFKASLLNLDEVLLPQMDQCGVELSVLSLSAPGIQGIPDKKQAVEAARRANDYLAEVVARNPTRFQGFAAVPLQDPEAAAQELTRCVKELGFRGLCQFGFSEIDTPGTMVFHDGPQYLPFWETMQELGVPCYLHPRYPVTTRKEMEGFPWLQGSVWGFGVDTATVALRMMTSGLFDKCPQLQIILGHLGEMIPTQVWRLDHRMRENPPRGYPAKKNPSDYLRNNFYLTTSGNFCTQTLLATLLVVGADRLLFSVDYPFEKMSHAAGWFDGVDVIGEADWQKIAHGNAASLLRLGQSAKQTAAGS